MIAWWRTCKALPASFPEYRLYQKNSKLRAFGYIYFSEGIFILYTIQGKKNVLHLQKRHWNEGQCSTKQNQNIKSILLSKFFWTHISCNTKNSSFRQKRQQQIVNCFHQPQQDSPKLFRARPLIQSNMYYQTKKCIPEILLDIIMWNS